MKMERWGNQPVVPAYGFILFIVIIVGGIQGGFPSPGVTVLVGIHHGVQGKFGFRAEIAEIRRFYGRTGNQGIGGSALAKSVGCLRIDEVGIAVDGMDAGVRESVVAQVSGNANAVGQTEDVVLEAAPVNIACVDAYGRRFPAEVYVLALEGGLDVGRSLGQVVSDKEGAGYGLAFPMFVDGNDFVSGETVFHAFVGMAQAGSGLGASGLVYQLLVTGYLDVCQRGDAFAGHVLGGVGPGKFHLELAFRVCGGQERTYRIRALG